MDDFLTQFGSYRPLLEASLYSEVVQLFLDKKLSEEQQQKILTHCQETAENIQSLEKERMATIEAMSPALSTYIRQEGRRVIKEGEEQIHTKELHEAEDQLKHLPL